MNSATDNTNVKYHREGDFSLTLPACLIIMDGFGLDNPGPGNAIEAAHTPCIDSVFAHNSWTKLVASGGGVGLPEGQMGNSEVGHLSIGAGRIVHQELTRINQACADGSLARNPVLCDAFRQATHPQTVLHLMGLLSDGGVHSSNQHLYALMRAAKAAGVAQIHVHCFMDGRDVAPKSGIDYIAQLEQVIDEIACDTCQITIGSIAGRFYAMDRDHRWGRVEQAWQALVMACPSTTQNALEVVQNSYDNETTDEFIKPVSLSCRGIQDGDAVIFFNFRPDRAREITRSLVDSDFEGFSRPRTPQISFVCLTEYDPEIRACVAFAKDFPQEVLADVIAEGGLRQFHIAETEKYAHVTFFLNGGQEQPKQGEQRCLIPSPQVSTYDLKPEMSAPEVAATLSSAIDKDSADVYIVNFANPDMVGHTGVIPAAIAAIEAVDSALQQVLDAMKRAGGIVLITADHGNADKMIAQDGQPFTAHSTALVPFVLVDFADTGYRLRQKVGALCDVAPTLLRLIGLPVPTLMTGESLLEERQRGCN